MPEKAKLVDRETFRRMIESRSYRTACLYEIGRKTTWVYDCPVNGKRYICLKKPQGFGFFKRNK